MKYQRTQRLWMKQHSELSESWLMKQIADDTGLLGFGDVEIASLEKQLSSGGRLDLLLRDVENDIRYEVELQLGATDESHIIRILEYWDLERRRFPNSQHVAVLVAEEITARFYNVISLFNGFIPIVALQVAALSIGDDAVTLSFTRVLDHRVLASADDDEPGMVTDRKYWESKASPKVCGLMDKYFEIVKSSNAEAILNYNKYYVGLTTNGKATNYVTFVPRKNQLNFRVKLPNDDEHNGIVDQLVEATDIVQNSYNPKYQEFQLVARQETAGDAEAKLQRLFTLAYERHMS